MRKILLTLLLALASAMACPSASGRSATISTDTIFNPTVVFSAMPRTYEIADIKVTGAPAYDDFIVLGYAGIKVGDRLEIPGNDLSNAIKRLMRQGLFAQARVKVLKTCGDKAWLELELRTQPRISEINYIGMKKGEREDLQKMLQLMKGNQITQNIVNRVERITRKYFADKGFGNAKVAVTLHEDLSNRDQMIVDISVDKRSKVKVHKIYITGNSVLSSNQIQRAMKKTNEKNKLVNLFRQKKFVEQDYRDDLNRIIEKYNEKGYRDAVIVSDSVVPYNEKLVDVYINVDEGKKYYIKDINWVGNTVYPLSLIHI